MSDTPRNRLAPHLLALACCALAACSGLPDVQQVSQAVQPYRIDKVQGNVVTREQIAVLKPGMPRRVVQEILGTPLLTSVFHADRWDYVFTLVRQGAEPQMRRVSVFFKNEALERFEADDLPSEAEFVSTLKTAEQGKNMPAMQASPESLQKFLPANRAESAPASGTAPASASYPPLESSRP